MVPPESFGNLLQHFTGSKDHNVALREAAVKQGLSISEYGVKTVETGEVFTTRDEAELYEFLGYQYIPPELRENSRRARRGAKGGAAGARRGQARARRPARALDVVPDGKNTIEEMARRCIERGYQYMAITDHSHYLRDGRLEAQWREVEQLNEKLAPFRILRGIEANIRANGEVDVADELLAELDWVVASLHQAFDKNPTERIISAMEHPRVHCIGHPTARKINKRPRPTSTSSA